MTGGEIQTDERFDIGLEIICEFVNWHVDGESCLKGVLHKYRMSHILNGLFSLCILPPLALYVKKLGICLLAIWIQDLTIVLGHKEQKKCCNCRVSDSC